jgi:hypothetical protein
MLCVFGCLITGAKAYRWNFQLIKLNEFFRRCVVMALLSLTPVQTLLWSYGPLVGAFNWVLAFVGGKWTKLWMETVWTSYHRPTVCVRGYTKFLVKYLHTHILMGKLLNTTIFEDGGRRFLTSVDNGLPDYMASQPRKQLCNHRR